MSFLTKPNLLLYVYVNQHFEKSSMIRDLKMLTFN